MNKKTILWVSRHTMTEDQQADLARIMGVTTDNLDIIQYADTVRSLMDITTNISDYDAACAVLPVGMLAQFWEVCNEFHVPLYVAKNRRDRDANGNFVFTHDGWDEILECRYRCRRA